MQNGNQVAVYEHSASSGYLLHAIVPGAHRLTVCLGERAEDVLSRLPASCRVFVFHVDLTLSAHVPLDRPRLAKQLQARNISVRNARVVDISKRAVHRACARAGVASAAAPLDGPPDELVLIKTTYNFHGRSESKLTPQQRRMLGYAFPYDVPPRRESNYRILHRNEVPTAIWTSPHWVVERYITNTAHRFHRVYIAGEAMVVSRVVDSSPFKKMPEGIVRRNYYRELFEASSRPPTELSEIDNVAALSSRIARGAQVEYGALDIVSDDRGGFYVVDINTTPHWGDGGHPNMLAYLGTGLIPHAE